jgi:hypothetical protein
MVTRRAQALLDQAADGVDNLGERLDNTLE